MKQFVLFAFAAFVFSACGTSSQDKAPAAPEVKPTPVSEVLDAYLDIKDALVTSNMENTVQPEKLMLEALNRVVADSIPADHKTHWVMADSVLRASLITMTAATDIEAKRAAFSSMTGAMTSAVKMFGSDGRPLFYQFCPMAFNDQGGYWLSRQKLIANPYFGSKMLRCGETKETL
jgi:Cu(I)/Ag(I) efflux system membrane fusion protein